MLVNANRGVSAQQAATHGVGSNVKSALSRFVVTAPVEAGQSFNMTAVPAGAIIIDAFVALDTLTGGTYSIGDKESPTRFADGVAPGARMASNHLYRYDKSSIITVTAKAAATGTSGAVKLVILYEIE